MLFEEQISTSAAAQRKNCSKCKVEKFYDDFSIRKGKPDSWCKACYILNARLYAAQNKDKVAQKKKEYAIKHKEHITVKRKEYATKNKEHIAKKQKEYFLKNKTAKKEYDRIYCKLNRDKKALQARQWRKARKQTDPEFRFKCNVSKQIWQLLSTGVGKNGIRTADILNSLGYSLADLRHHLEDKFTEGMTWENYGKWHLDHIRPVCSFNFSSIQDHEFKLCWALDNLQPLWAEDNLKKVATDKKQALKK